MTLVVFKRNALFGVRQYEVEVTRNLRNSQHLNYLQRSGVCCFLFRQRRSVIRASVPSPRAVLVASVMIMAIISERGLGSTFRKPHIRRESATYSIAK